MRRPSSRRTPRCSPGWNWAGVPVATALGLATGLPVAFVRKAAKPYGTQQLAEGAEIAGRRVLVVEDVVTSGGQVLLSTTDLRARGAIIRQALCVIDREEGGAENLSRDGLTLAALFTANELTAAAS